MRRRRAHSAARVDCLAVVCVWERVGQWSVGWGVIDMGVGDRGEAALCS